MSSDRIAKGSRSFQCDDVSERLHDDGTDLKTSVFHEEAGALDRAIRTLRRAAGGSASVVVCRAASTTGAVIADRSMGSETRERDDRSGDEWIDVPGAACGRFPFERSKPGHTCPLEQAGPCCVIAARRVPWTLASGIAAVGRACARVRNAGRARRFQGRRSSCEGRSTASMSRRPASATSGPIVASLSI